MLLSIDKNKIREALAANPPPYSITSSHLPMTTISAEPTPLAICGTTSTLPVELKKAREHLAAVRRKFAESGGRFLSAEELEEEVDLVRGRLTR